MDGPQQYAMTYSRAHGYLVSLTYPFRPPQSYPEQSWRHYTTYLCTADTSLSFAESVDLEAYDAETGEQGDSYSCRHLLSYCRTRTCDCREDDIGDGVDDHIGNGCVQEAQNGRNELD